MPRHLRWPNLEVPQILEWADAHYARTGSWPTVKSGAVREMPGTTWGAVHQALYRGNRGLQGGSTLPRLLNEWRGARYVPALPPLTQAQILSWADTHHERTGRWPTLKSGPVREMPGTTWCGVHQALYKGNRGLAGGSGLTRLLSQWRGVRNPAALPPLTEEKILAWADAHFQRCGSWPTDRSGELPEAPGEGWQAVDACLRVGLRGLPGSSSLARLLARDRGVRNVRDLPAFSEEQILLLADAHHERTGQWPGKSSGPIGELSSETWAGVDRALLEGLRGLPGGSSLASLLGQRRGRRNQRTPPRLTEEVILGWADAYHARCGEWPGEHSGPIAEAPDETWMAVTKALADGLRGLPGGSSLARLLAARRGARNRVHPPPLTIEEILAWADAYRARTCRWPHQLAGKIEDAPGETWGGVNIALQLGYRSLPGGSSLARLLAHHRGARNPAALPHLTEQEILAWASLHHQQTGQWPQIQSGPIEAAPGETWSGVNKALRLGRRGLPGGSTLARVLRSRAGVRTLKSPALRERQILEWARLHCERSGSWPSRASGPVAEASGLTWNAVDIALKHGLRGLPGGASLSQLKAKQQLSRP